MRFNRLTPMLAVADLKRTITFYCDMLDFRCMRTFGDPEPVWCHLVKDGVEIMFNQPPSDELAELPARARDFQVFYVYPDDVTGLRAKLAAKGLPVTDLRTTVYGMKEFELRDPDGIWLWFGQATSDAPTVEE